MVFNACIASVYILVGTFGPLITFIGTFPKLILWVSVEQADRTFNSRSSRVHILLAYCLWGPGSPPERTLASPPLPTYCPDSACVLSRKPVFGLARPDFCTCAGPRIRVAGDARSVLTSLQDPRSGAVAVVEARKRRPRGSGGHPSRRVNTERPRPLPGFSQCFTCAFQSFINLLLTYCLVSLPVTSREHHLMTRKSITLSSVELLQWLDKIEYYGDVSSIPI